MASEPSHLRATSPWYQAMSGRATLATSPRNLAAQSMTDFAQRASLGVREPQPPLQLGLQDAIFGHQIFVPRQQLLVHNPADEGQDARPIHSGTRFGPTIDDKWAVRIMRRNDKDPSE